MSSDELLFECAEAMERLYPYLDRELEAVEYEAVQAHLAACGNCASLFRFEERILTIVGERLTALTAPPHLRQRLMGLYQTLHGSSS